MLNLKFDCFPRLYGFALGVPALFQSKDMHTTLNCP